MKLLKTFQQQPKAFEVDFLRLFDRLFTVTFERFRFHVLAHLYLNV
jgi:hypothetical protein